MTALILRAALWCLLLAAPLVQAAQSAPVLLWLTSDITTAPRTAMVQRLASEAGLGFVHIDYPLGGPAVLDGAQAPKLEGAQRAPPPAADLTALDASGHMVAYLQAGGPRNLKNAIALARATVAGVGMPTLPAP